jgi:DNA-binding GntR family transcriptional regulator
MNAPTSLNVAEPPAAIAAPRPLLAPIMGTQLLRQQIVATLHNAIEDGRLRAGDRLVERELCAQLGVSRTSLREALRDLEANGIVTKVNARELAITRLGREDAVNLFHLRGGIEAVVVEQFMKKGDAAAMAACRAANERILAVPPGPESQEAQRAFYALLCEGAANPFAFEMLMNILIRLSVIRGPSLFDKAAIAANVSDRRTILARMAQGDLGGALEAVRTHVERAIATTIAR